MSERTFAKWCGRLGAWLVLALWVLPVSAQTNAARELPGRFLFIVDTSAAMRRRAPAMQKAMEKLLRSGLNGQLRPNDTVGVWTFAEELYAGRFPLQLWSTETSESVASNIVAFVKAQPYQMKSRFEVVVPALERIVKSSNKLTVLLVTGGDEKISGTPFDSKIQSVLDQHFKMQQKAREPFITVLRASRGQFINATVNLMPWSVEFPAFPPEPALVESPKPKPPEPKSAPRPTVPSLIVFGKKPELPAVANTNAVATAPTATNAPLNVEAASQPVTPTAPPLNPGENKLAPLLIPALTPAETLIRPAEPAAPTPSPNVPSATATGTAPIVTSSPVEAAKPGTAVETKIARPITAPVVPAPVVQSAAAPPPVGPSSPANEVAPTNPPAPVALAVQPDPGLGRLGVVAIGIGAVVLTGGLFFVRQRRARHAVHASLITSSMDRDRK